MISSRKPGSSQLQHQPPNSVLGSKCGCQILCACCRCRYEKMEDFDEEEADVEFIDKSECPCMCCFLSSPST